MRHGFFLFLFVCFFLSAFKSIAHASPICDDGSCISTTQTPHVDHLSGTHEDGEHADRHCECHCLHTVTMMTPVSPVFQFSTFATARSVYRSPIYSNPVLDGVIQPPLKSLI